MIDERLSMIDGRSSMIDHMANSWILEDKTQKASHKGGDLEEALDEKSASNP